MWGPIVIQWLHVLLGMFWFGSTLYLDVLVIPAVMTLPLEQQRTVSKPLTTFSERVIIPAGLLVMLLGLVSGIVFGPVRSLDFLFGTAYGLTFLIAGLAALATFAWGQLILTPAARRLDTFPLAEVMKPGRTVAVAFAAQVQARWQETEGVLHQVLSAQRGEQFGRDYGVWLNEGRQLSRSVFVLDRADRIAYAEYVADQLREPDYAAALQAVQQAVLA